MTWIKNTLKALIPEVIITGIKRGIRKIKFRGKEHYCPICKSSIHEFHELGYDLAVITEKQIIGGGLRKALCPVCESSDRTRLLHLFIKSQTTLYSGRFKVLHMAPEPVLSKELRKNKKLDYLTADINPEHVMEQMDLTHIQKPDNTFDTVIANHVLEHIPDDRKAMTEILRVLKPGGMALLQVPLSKIMESTFEDFTVVEPAKREAVFGQSDHVRIYGQDYPERLRKAGFKVEIYRWAQDSAMVSKGSRMGLNPEELVFYCYKPRQ